MLDRVKRVTNQALAGLGYEIRKVADPIEVQRALLRGHPVRTIFDVGANLGNVTARYREVFSDATVHAFEPFPGCIESLEQRFARDERVTVVPSAVGAEPGSATLHVSAGVSTHSMLPRPHTSKSYHADRSPVTGEIEVPVLSLDRYAQSASIEHIDILKIDVEGAEAAVLEGAAGLLGAARVSLLAVEVMFVPHYEGQALFHDLTRQLEGPGYTLYDLPFLRYAPSGQLRWADAVYVSPAIRRDVIDR